MRCLLFALTLLATPIAAQEFQWSTDVELWGGYSDISPRGDAGRAELDEENLGIVGIDVRTARHFDAWVLQLDAGGYLTNAERDPDNPNGNIVDTFYFGSHLARKIGEDTLLGGFLYGSTTYGGESDSVGEPELRGEAVSFGLEGQVYRGRHTFYAQIGVVDGSESVLQTPTSRPDVFDDGAFVRGEWRYFPTDESRFTLGAYVGKGRDSRDINADECGIGTCNKFEVWGFDARYDRAITDEWDGFIQYQASVVDEKVDALGGQCCGGVLDQRVNVGVVRRFGAASTIERDRKGAPFTVPQFDRWAGYTTEVLDTGN